jgi:hypothetical protein
VSLILTILYRSSSLSISLTNYPARLEGGELRLPSPQKLKDTMRQSILSHYINYSGGLIDKQTIPLYLFSSGAGTGKSRSGLEFHKTALQCLTALGSRKPKTLNISRNVSNQCYRTRTSSCELRKWLVPLPRRDGSPARCRCSDVVSTPPYA